MSPRRFALAGLATLMLGACSTSPKAPATAEATGPVAYLAPKTSGNTLRGPGSGRAVLELHVIEGRDHVKQIAQCDQIYTGAALGGGTARELQVVLCDGDFNNDGEYSLISEPGVVIVRRKPDGGIPYTVLEYRLRDTQARAIAKR
ncbi:hypothetical protein [Bordetella sp. 02P26C-1]|uniref:hypothetical protein n=1 Tax=Bordetella sp. 02P26C-1 TaxID=2683195 RepID=UPI001355FDB5|nr:hypothetical protein [Bordetella sp. 02P26C-1]MVW78070.1 hypothetical protein [Bordetella sp. 02P26C-1]